MVGGAQVSLLVDGGPNNGMTIPLSGRPITFGRRQDNDVVVEETTVSRRHALILETSSGYVLRDLNSTNGSFINRIKVGLGEHPLKHSDRIVLAGSNVDSYSNRNQTTLSRSRSKGRRPERYNSRGSWRRKPQDQRSQPRPSREARTNNCSVTCNRTRVVR